jgi:hypothetical protein
MRPQRRLGVVKPSFVARTHRCARAAGRFRGGLIVNFRLDAHYEPSLDDVKKEHVSNQAATSKFSDKFCPCCGEAVKRRRPNAIFCCSRCLEQFHRDRKCGAARIKRRPKRRRPLL